jgi:hypothetical protein
MVGTEGTIKVLLPEYQVYKCFIMLNNCAIQNSKLGTLKCRNEDYQYYSNRTQCGLMYGHNGQLSGGPTSK